VSWRTALGISTDAQGSVSLTVEHPGAGVVVATHPEFLAAGIEVLPGERLATVVLDPAPPVTALVHSDVMKASGAVVRSWGQVSAGGVSVPVERVVATDDQGRASVSPLPGRSMLRAESEGLLSETWVGEHRAVTEPILLSLAATFGASGRVVGAPSQAVLQRSFVRARRARDEGVWNRPRDDWRRYGAMGAVAADGTWALAGVPWDGPGTYLFRLESTDALPVEASVDVPSPGVHVGLDLEWQGGNSLSFLVVDSGAKPIPDVELVACWRPAEDWKRIATTTDHDGRGTFTALPGESIWVRTYARGYGNATFGSFLPQADSEPFTLVLGLAASIEGVCLLEGEPVEDFTVTYWGDDPSSRSTASFSGRTDGTFALDDAPSGELHLFAHSDTQPPGETVDLDAPPGDPIRVTLELSRAIPTRGRVIDARTGTPIAGARVQVKSRFRGRQLEDWGAVHFADGDGRWRDVPASPGTFVNVSAAGYQAVNLTPRTEGTGESDLGLVSLFPTGRVHVQLVGSAIDDFSGFQGTVWGQSPLLSASPEGEILFEDQPPGKALLLIHTPMGYRIDASLHLDPGRSWEYRVSVGTPRTIEVQVVPASEVEIPEDLWLSVEHTDLTGLPTRCLAPFDDDGTARVDFVVGNELLLSAVRSSGEQLGVLWARIPDAGFTRLELPLSGRTRDLLLLDPEGRPVGNALVLVMAPKDHHGSVVEYTSDTAGHVRMLGIASDQVELRIKPDAGSVCAPQSVDLGVPDDPLVVRVDTEAHLRAHLVERQSPAAGVPIGVYEPDGAWMSAVDGTSNGEGVVDIPGLSPTPWELRVTGGGWWPTRATITAAPEGEATELQVRRMGGIRLRVRQAGLPVAGAALDLFALEWEQASVRQWCEEGRAQVGAAGFVTGTDGEIELAGLPNGPYRWVVTAGDGSQHSGELEVPALESGLAVLDL